ncbi:MAG: type I restriction endonuclease subunit R [Cyanobacteria bacterium P01_G01_bin.54]
METLKTVAISEKTTLKRLRERFNLSRSTATDFCAEMVAELPVLDGEQPEKLARICDRYFYQLEAGMILEAGVKMMIVSPLLDLAGFYDPPFRTQFEPSVQLEVDEEGEVLQGRIDVLVVQEQLWICVLEAKRTTFSLGLGIPQTLAYLLANPNLQRPSYGLLTSGDNFLFLKLQPTTPPTYGLSKQFSILNPGDLEQVLQILVRLGQLGMQS